MISKSKLFTISILTILFLSMFVGVWQIKPAHATTGTLGNTSGSYDGADGVSGTTSAVAGAFQAVSSGEVYQMTAIVKNEFGTATNCTLAIWNGTSSEADTMIGVSEQKAITNSAAQNITFTMVTNATITNGDWYWLGMSGATSVSVYWHYQSSGGIAHKTADTVFAVDEPWGTTSIDYTPRKLCIYATYVATTDEPPTIQYFDVSTMQGGTSCQIHAYIIDDVGVSGSIMQSNVTGTAVNQTWVSGSTGSWYGTLPAAYSVTNFTCYANDTANQWSTSTFYLRSSFGWFGDYFEEENSSWVNTPYGASSITLSSTWAYSGEYSARINETATGFPAMSNTTTSDDMTEGATVFSYCYAKWDTFSTTQTLCTSGILEARNTSANVIGYVDIESTDTGATWHWGLRAFNMTPPHTGWANYTVFTDKPAVVAGSDYKVVMAYNHTNTMQWLWLWVNDTFLGYITNPSDFDYWQNTLYCGAAKNGYQYLKSFLYIDDIQMGYAYPSEGAPPSMQKPELVLHTVDDKIYFANDTECRLRGVNYGSFGDITGPTGGNYATMYASYNTMFASLSALDINVVRIMIICDWWSQNFRGQINYVNSSYVTDQINTDRPYFQDNVRAFLDAGLNNNIYVVVSKWTPDYDTYNGHADTPIPTNTFTDSGDFLQWHLDFLTEYGNYSNLILEMYNEPSGTTYYDTNMQAFEDCIVGVRAAGYDTLFIWQWGYFLGFEGTPAGSVNHNDNWFLDALALSSTDTNIVYSAHLYDPSWLNPHTTDTVYDWINETWAAGDASTHNVPLFCGELGATLGNDEAELFYPVALNVMNEYNINYVGFTWSSGTTGWSMYSGTEALPEPLTYTGSLFMRSLADEIFAFSTLNISSIPSTSSTITMNGTTNQMPFSKEIVDGVYNLTVPDQISKFTHNSFAGDTTIYTDGQTYNAYTYAFNITVPAPINISYIYIYTLLSGNVKIAFFSSAIKTVSGFPANSLLPDTPIMESAITAVTANNWCRINFTETEFAAGVYYISTKGSAHQIFAGYQTSEMSDYDGVFAYESYVVDFTETFNVGGYVRAHLSMYIPSAPISTSDYTFSSFNNTVFIPSLIITLAGDQTITVYYDSIAITITSPTNTTYTTSTVPVQLSASGGTIDTILWNCTYTNGTVAYANTVYTVETSMTLGNGSYIFNAFANNTDGNWDEETVTFTVAIPAISSSTLGYQLSQGAIAAAGFMGIVMLLGMVYVVAEGKDVKFAVMFAVGEVLLLVTMLILSQLAILG
jgi:hypothetical protein